MARKIVIDGKIFETTDEIKVAFGGGIFEETEGVLAQPTEIFRGDNQITEIYRGDNLITEIYRGDNKVYG